MVGGGLRVDQVGRQPSGVAPEQDVGQRAVAPHEPVEVQLHEQDSGRVEESVLLVGAPLARQEIGVRQGEVEVAGHDDALEGLAAAVGTVGHGGHGDNRGHGPVRHLPEEAVLAASGLVADLLQRVDPPGELDEAHEVAGRAPCHAHEARVVPLAEGQVPVEVEKVDVAAGGRQLELHAILPVAAHRHALATRRLSSHLRRPPLRRPPRIDTLHAWLPLPTSPSPPPPCTWPGR